MDEHAVPTKFEDSKSVLISGTFNIILAHRADLRLSLLMGSKPVRKELEGYFLAFCAVTVADKFKRPGLHTGARPKIQLPT